MTTLHKQDAFGQQVHQSVEEIDRIATQLSETLEFLKVRFAHHQQRKSHSIVGILEKYIQQGIFPHPKPHMIEQSLFNPSIYKQRYLTPCFVDDEKRDCAVAALLRQTGHEQLVDSICKQANLDYIFDMIRSDYEHGTGLDPNTMQQLKAWADAYHLHIKDLADIQPSYDFPIIPPIVPR